VSTPYYERENVRLYLGDCRDVLPTLEAGCVSAVVTDPPYGIVNKFGVMNSSKGNRRLQFEWDDSSAVASSVASAVALVKRPGAAIVFCGFDTATLVQSAICSSGMIPKPMAWVKKCPPPAGKGNWWPSAFEIGVYAYHRGAWFGDTNTKRSNVFVYDAMRHGQPGKNGHPTQKPLKLMDRLICGVVPPGTCCIDPFMGSGSTGVAAIRSGRQFIGIELDRHWLDISIRRIEAEFNRHPLFAEEESA
jgi:DNA modification methylase